jgi:hypothetical protein
MKSFRVGLLVALALLASWQAADAQTKDPFKFSVPVQVPRAIPPAGTYRFQFLTPTLVRVTSLDGKRMYGTFTTVPVLRNVPPNRGQVRFQNVGVQPLRLIAWYMTGNSTGNQPLYPKGHKSAPETNIASH